MRGREPRVVVWNFAQKMLVFSTLANFDLKKGAQFNRNRFKQPSHPKVNSLKFHLQKKGFYLRIWPHKSRFCSESQKLWTFGYMKIFNKFMPFDFEAL